MNDEDRTAFVENSDSLLSPYEEQAMMGEKRKKIADLVTRLISKQYINNYNGNLPDNLVDLIFILNNKLRRAKRKNNPELLQESDILYLLNPRLQNLNEQKAFANKLYQDVIDLIE